LEDEIEILNSRTNFIDLVKKLGLNVKIESVGRISDSELYKNPPFKISFLSPDSTVFKSKLNFKINVVSESALLITEKQGKEEVSEHFFGSMISIGNVELVITPNIDNIKNLVGKAFAFSVSPVTDIAQKYQAKMNISIISQFSDIVTLNLKDPVEEKARDIINTLIEIYNDNAIQDKKAIADKTSDFINDRIAEISEELSSVDGSAVTYKSSRGITDVAAQANVNMNVGAESQRQLQEVEMQRAIAYSMKDLVDSQDEFDVLPSNIGLSDGTVASTVARYNQMVLERNRLLESSNRRNPIIVNLDQELGALRQTLKSSLTSTTNNLDLQASNISGNLRKINSKLYAAPKNEQALREISRQQETTESLYLYLLQKREESQISFASTAPKSKVIDKAYMSSPFPVSPKKPLILFTALVFGFSIPVLIIYILVLIDNKIHSKRELEKIVGEDIPVLAELPRLSSEDSHLVKFGDRTVLAESLRILRTNLDYLIKAQLQKDGGHVIFVTSSVPSEGKSLTASNLAMIYAKANKKVVLVGADIRNPMIEEYYSVLGSEKGRKSASSTRKPGLTDYLISQELTPKDITSSALLSAFNVDLILSGKLMPNPSELLMSERLGELFNTLKSKYDYVIVDTAPMLVVSDTQLITKYADQIIYITRAGQTETKVLEFPLKLRKEGKLPNLSFVVNAVKEANLGYGGGKYGYGYTAKKQRGISLPSIPKILGKVGKD
jgi:capsular exopolysaccharide synthesis family protein